MLKWINCLFNGHQYGKREKFFPPQRPSEHHGWLYGWKRVCKRCGDVKFVE